ncbi:hypothetical protein [Sinomonas gamaensis]|uniref:hypothetical protein n=1 Tax=Sinomonas gamaensis TaxID=2565624 RepID=UPI00148617FA|nr:hypothetical protein [Sinomonas gamaensis]
MSPNALPLEGGDCGSGTHLYFFDVPSKVDRWLANNEDLAKETGDRTPVVYGPGWIVQSPLAPQVADAMVGALVPDPTRY